MKSKYSTTFVVLGNSRFPVDMLRYDACMPATHNDVAEIMTTTDRDEIAENRSKGASFRVAIVKHHADRVPNLTPDRWRSFGWVIEKNSVKTEVVK